MYNTFFLYSVCFDRFPSTQDAFAQQEIVFTAGTKAIKRWNSDADLSICQYVGDYKTKQNKQKKNTQSQIY